MNYRYNAFLTVDGTTYDLADYNGDDLMRDASVVRTETLHRDLEPVQDRCTITVDYKASLYSILTSIDTATDATVHVVRQPERIIGGGDADDPFAETLGGGGASGDFGPTIGGGGAIFSFFFGYLRPVTEVEIGQDDQVIELEIIDTTEALKRQIGEDRTPPTNRRPSISFSTILSRRSAGLPWRPKAAFLRCSNTSRMTRKMICSR